MNVAYFSVTNDVTKASTVNGITNTGDLEVVNFKDMNMKTTLSKDVTLRSSPYTTLPNKAGILEKGTTITVTGMGDKYIRIVYNGNVFYINDVNCFIMKLDPIDFNDVDMDVECLKNVSLLYKPYAFLNNNIYYEVLAGENLKIVGVNTEFVKVLYQNEYYYINDVDFYNVLNDNIYNGSVRS